jgi:hypothetical protein
MASLTGQESIDNVNKQQPIALAINLGVNVGLSLLTLGAFCWLRPKNGGKAMRYLSRPLLGCCSVFDLVSIHSNPPRATTHPLFKRCDFILTNFHGNRS